MLLHNDSNGDQAHNFKWGIKKGVGRTNKGLHFYESFTYHGVEYSLFDCAYFHNVGFAETYIGKLVKIYETPGHEKKVKVVWFFHPCEIRNFLGDYEPRWNELFLASGEGKGLSNINHLESIVKKCNVVCASPDKRNPQATKQELRLADYIFYFSFDVGARKMLKNFADHIDGIKVEQFFNKLKNQKVISQPILKSNVKVEGHAVREGKSSSSCPVVKASEEVTATLGEQEGISNGNAILKLKTPINGPGPSKFPCNQVDDKAKNMRSGDSSTRDASNIQPHKKRKLLQDEREGTISNKGGPQVAKDRGAKTVNKIKLARRPDADKRLWFKQLSWGEKLRTAEEAGTLVLLENLDPSFTSSEIEDLVWHALNQVVEAKAIENSTFSSTRYGKALVIFTSKEAAESAISKLQKQCLMVAGGRPVVCSRGSLRDPGKPVNFIGHISLPKVWHRQSEEMRKAVSTSHFSQPNTLEYNMAIEWRMLQEKSDNWWKQLHTRQAKEIEDARSLLKVNYHN